MNILVTNDDGINSIGLKKLAIFLKNKGHDVYVYAPDGNRSGASHSMIFRHDLFVKRVDIIEGIQCFSVSGSPCDSVRFGVELCPKNIDIVFSGINYGSNLATDSLYSGTVQAGIEANFNGKPSIALSNCALKDCNFDETLKVLDEILDDLIRVASSEYCLNVNIPNLDKNKIKGFKVCRPGTLFYDDKYIKVGDGVYQLQGNQLMEKGDNDVYFSSLGYVTISPIVNRIYDDKFFNIILDLNKEIN